MDYIDDNMISQPVTESLFNAASSGNISELNSILKYLKINKKIIKSDLFNSFHDGITPLLLACRNGHLKVARFLVEECDADIEKVGEVTFEGEVIEGASPLWCASAAGYLSIVKYLVESGAMINKSTYTKSTPLRAACYDGYGEIVKFLIENGADPELANRHGHTCLMIACYKTQIKIVKYLLSKNVDVNKKSLKGNTALHDCAESGSLDILKLLLDYGSKMEKDFYGMSPLLTAAVSGNTGIVEFLIKLPDCSRIDKIDALELLGATYVDKKRDYLGAVVSWKKAMIERFENGEVLLKAKRTDPVVAAYNNITEANTMDELNEIISDPDEIKIQALLVRERILGPVHPDTSYYIRYRGAVYADSGDFPWCVSLWMYALDMQQNNLEILSPLTQSSFLSFTEFFYFMMTNTSFSGIRNFTSQSPAFSAEFLLENMLKVFDKCFNEITKGFMHLKNSKNLTADLGKCTAGRNCYSLSKLEKEWNCYDRYLVIILQFISLIKKLTLEHTCSQKYKINANVYSQHNCYIDLNHNDYINPSNNRNKYAGYYLNKDILFIEKTLNNLLKFYSTIKTLVKLIIVNDEGRSLLHLACTELAQALTRHPVCTFPDINVINLLLKSGADVNIQDKKGNTPLHCATHIKDNKIMIEMVSLLLDYGAHLDLINNDSISALDLLTSLEKGYKAWFSPVVYTNLQCLAAKTIKKNNLIYVGILPKKLEDFIIMH